MSRWISCERTFQEASAMRRCKLLAVKERFWRRSFSRDHGQTPNIMSGYWFSVPGEMVLCEYAINKGGNTRERPCCKHSFTTRTLFFRSSNHIAPHRTIDYSQHIFATYTHRTRWSKHIIPSERMVANHMTHTNERTTNVNWPHLSVLY